MELGAWGFERDSRDYATERTLLWDKPGPAPQEHLGTGVQLSVILGDLASAVRHEKTLSI